MNFKFLSSLALVLALMGSITFAGCAGGGNVSDEAVTEDTTAVEATEEMPAVEDVATEATEEMPVVEDAAVEVTEEAPAVEEHAAVEEHEEAAH